jgi:integrase
MSKPIHQPTFRNDPKRCKVRTEPYWGPKLAKGAYLGFRKISADEGSWVARIRTEDEHGKLVQRYQSLDPVTEQFDYLAAAEKARAWFATVEAAPRNGSTVVTVADACHKYVKAVREDKDERPDLIARKQAADDAERRFERTVYGREKSSRKKAVAPNALAKIKLTELTTKDLEGWRAGLSIGKAAKNRTLTALKAALNLAARDNKHVLAKMALEVAGITPFEKAGKRRDLYLDLKQRRALLKATKGALRDFLSAVMWTGARAGELTAATVSQFKPREKYIKLGAGKKTGERNVTFEGSPKALALFNRLAKGKEPGDRLLTRDDGKPWAHSDWDELVRAAAKAAKLPDGVCLYTLRHSYITQQIDTGATSLKDVARQVGTSLVMIDQHYGQTSKESRKRLGRAVMV